MDQEIEERNYAKDRLTKADLEEILALAEVKDVINARHATAKENEWKERPPSKSAFVKAVLEDNNLLRRPILIENSRVVIGYDEPAIRELLGS